VAKRGAALELAVLGLLQESPMHGYELRKQLNVLLGWGRVLSYGTLYPCLKSLGRAGHLEVDLQQPRTSKRITARQQARPTSRGSVEAAPLRRAKIVYRLTPVGQARLDALLSESGPSAWDDDNFGVHFAFFSRTDTRTRVRILEGRRNRLEERLDGARRGPLTRDRSLDAYAQELHRHGLESLEREVRWLTKLIDMERAGRALAVEGSDQLRENTSGDEPIGPPPPAPHPVTNT